MAFIAAKRDGRPHSRCELKRFVTGMTAGQIPDYQTAAWLMAVRWRGLDDAETLYLTDAIADSGSRLSWSWLDRPVVDKHSTGGVGDKTSLVVVPLAAACGMAVPKLSGRGLGPTGGTLDKLEAISGFEVNLGAARLMDQVGRIGLAIAAQSEDLAPADGRLYALRDVTATIDSIPLIASSIMGKKLAGGASTLALDVKCGSGAFMPDFESARTLAESMAAIGSAASVNVRAYISAMDRPLGFAVGNSLEVSEAIECLSGEGPSDLRELAITIVAGLLRDCGLRSAPRAARQATDQALASGRALAKFAQMVDAQGGDLDAFQSRPPHAEAVRAVFSAPSGGHLAGIDAGAIASLVHSLGGGRSQKSDPIDHAVGIVLACSVGEAIVPEQPLATIYARSRAQLADSQAQLREAFTITNSPVPSGALLLGQVARSAASKN